MLGSIRSQHWREANGIRRSVLHGESTPTTTRSIWRSTFSMRSYTTLQRWAFYAIFTAKEHRWLRLGPKLVVLLLGVIADLEQGAQRICVVLDCGSPGR